MKLLYFFNLLVLLYLIALTGKAAAVSGDCNHDGNVTSVDALIALKMSTGKLEFESVADVNGDGKVTAYDAFRILMMATGDEDELFFELVEVVKSYDLSSFLKDVRMNWKIEESDGGELTIGVVIENGKIVRFMKGGIEDPEMNAYTDEKTVRELLSSRDPKALKDALDSGRIRLEGVGTVNQIKVSLMNFLSRFT